MIIKYPIKASDVDVSYIQKHLPEDIADIANRAYEQGRADTRAEIHTALIDEMAMLNEAGLTENNLKTFAYRVKDITEQLEVKYD